MFYIGLDLGQRRDHSAVVLVERADYRAKVLVRFVERLPLGVPYPKVVERVRAIVSSVQLRGKCTLTVDATGVGAPVVDMLRAARLGCELNAIVITASVKRDLMAEVQVLLENRQLKIGVLKEGSRLMRELADMRMSVSGTGRVRMGADGAGEHDDLVIALALACWRAKKGGNMLEKVRDDYRESEVAREG